MAGVSCTICKENVTENEFAIRTGCEHIFHQACLKLWEKDRETCPTCQTVINTKEVIPPNKGATTRSKSAIGTAGSSRSKPSTSKTSEQQQQLAQQQQLQLQQQQLQVEQQLQLQVDQQLQQQQPLDQQQPLEQPQQRQQQIHMQQRLEIPEQHRQPSPMLPSPLNLIDSLTENRIKTIVSAVVSARQVNLVAELETGLFRRLEQKIENSIANIMQQLNVSNNNPPTNTQANHTPNINSLPQTNINFESPMNRSHFNRQLDSMQFSEMSSGNNSSHVARLINSWNIKFDGSSRLSVDSFIYRLESQVVDTLNGNFNLLCENIQSLLSDAAKDWYWRYRRSVPRVTWPSFCEALRRNFEEHKSDTEIKENIRNRKQGPNESFDDYRNTIYKLTERLSNQIPEYELVEIIQRGLRPRIRQQLLYMPITSVSELRKLCLKGEHLFNEINKATVVANNKPFIRRHISEVDLGSEIANDSGEIVVEVDEVKASNLTCWNCRKKGHRYQDCIEERTIFCYGCGEANTYKPNCAKCLQGNLKVSVTRQQRSRNDHNCS